MTDPIDDPALPPDGEATPPAPETPAWGPPVAAAPEPAPSWIQPKPTNSRRTRGCLILLAVGLIVLVVGCVGLVFLGSQVQKILAGTIEFGTGGSGCGVTGRATTFPSSSKIHSVAFLQRQTGANEAITVVVTFPDASSELSKQTVEGGVACLTQDIDSGLAPGHYGLEYRAGTETLAKGGFDITP